MNLSGSLFARNTIFMLLSSPFKLFHRKCNVLTATFLLLTLQQLLDDDINGEECSDRQE